jgi:hypothetical protein
MNKKTIYIVVAVLVVVIVVAGAGILLLNGGNGGDEPQTTPTPEPVSVADATSLQFTVEEDTDGAIVVYEFAAKNANTDEIVIRVDIPGDEASYSYIVDVAQEKSWYSLDEGATWEESDYTTDEWIVTSFNEHVTNLADWDGHAETYEYTAENEASIVISAIHVNPTLDDSLFATSASS